MKPKQEIASFRDAVGANFVTKKPVFVSNLSETCRFLQQRMVESQNSVTIHSLF